MNEDDRQELIESELAQIAALAERLGLPREVEPADVGVELPTAAQIIASAQAKDRRRRRARNRRIGALALAAAVAVVAGVLVTLRPWSPDTARAKPLPSLDYEFSSAARIAYAPGRDPSAELRELAATAARTTVDQGAGRVQFIATDNWFSEIDDTKQTSVIVPTLRRVWMLPSGRVDTVEVASAALRSDGRGVVKKASDEVPTGKTVDTEPPGTFAADFATSLPTEPSALAAALLAHAGCQSRALGYARSVCLYLEIIDLFNLYVVPQKTVSALWSVLSGEKGFRLLGSVNDRAGRGGVGVSIINPRKPQYRRILIISVKTGQLLGSEDILIRSDPRIGVKAPAVTSFSAIVRSQWTDYEPTQ